MDNGMNEFLDYMNSMGLELLDGYYQTGSLEYLEQALKVFEEVAEGSPTDSPKLPGYLTNVGIVFNERYAQMGELEDLEQAIQAYERAFELSPPDLEDLPEIQNNLGTGLSDRYATLGDPSDLERAIHLFSQAIEGAQSDPYRQARFLTNLGIGLRHRYTRSGELSDLERVIQAAEQAVDQTPHNSPDFAGYVNALGAGLWTRYKRLEDLNDLERAIQSWQEAVTSSSFDSPRLPGYLNNLGNGLRAKYGGTEDYSDLEGAIQAYEGAVEMTPPNSPDMSRHLNNLATGYHDRYKYTEDLDDLDQSIQAWESAIDHTPTDSPILIQHMANLGEGLRDRYERTGEAAALEEAKQAYQRAAEGGLEIATAEGLKAASSWMEWAFDRQDWDEVLHAYTYAHQAIERLIKVQLARRGKEVWLRDAQGLPSLAAYAYAKQGDLKGSILSLEKGRTRLLAETLARERADLDRVRENDPEIYNLFQEAATQLHQFGGTTQVEDQPPDAIPFHLSPEILREKILQAQSDLENAIEQIRKIPSYEGFLTDFTWDDIQATLQELDGTPINFLLTTPSGSLCILVSQSEKHSEISLSPLWMESFTQDHLHGLLDDWFKAYNLWQGGYRRWIQSDASRLSMEMRDARRRVPESMGWFETIEEVTHQLWQGLMEPVVSQLQDRDVDQVVLIPAGLLALLPLHASRWEEDGKRNYALDQVAFAYAPSTQALLHSARITKSAPNERLLAVDEPQPITWGGPLPSAEAEVEAIAQLFENPQIFRHSNAIMKDVLTALPEVHVAHFACHGAVNWENPDQSGILMANDEMLSVEAISHIRLEGARLATLSACETGIVGTQIPDEVIALPSAFIRAGFAGVVASLWPVADRSTARLMESFYRLWREHDMAPTLALREAQRLLRDQSDGDYQHPFWWAAFYLTGA